MGAIPIALRDAVEPDLQKEYFLQWQSSLLRLWLDTPHKDALPSMVAKARPRYARIWNALRQAVSTAKQELAENLRKILSKGVSLYMPSLMSWSMSQVNTHSSIFTESSS